jgi:hypothetical protein
MAIQTLKVPILTAPSAANSVSVTPSGTAWAASSWVQLLASTPSASMVLGIIVDSGVAADGEIEIGVGSSGSETLIATIPFAVDSVTIGIPCQLWLPIPANVATGTRIAARLRKSGANTTAWALSMMYCAQSNAGVTGTSKVLKCLPFNAAPLSVTPSGTSWANSSYGQFTASMPANAVIAGISINAANANPHEIDLATGSSGSESVFTTLRVNYQSVAGFSAPIYHNPVYDGVSSGQRVAIRFRKNGTNANAVTFKLMYYEKPI